MSTVFEATADAGYAHRLERLQRARWKRVLDVQAPYRWHIRHLRLGRTLDVGCGIGRNLAHLNGNGVGVDHNPESVEMARGRGLIAYTLDEWSHALEAEAGSFDTMLLSHIIEHMSEAEAEAIVSRYIKFIRPGGKVVFITPQERGYAAEATHVRLVGFPELERLCQKLGLIVDLRRSFPFPRAAGRLFAYNEFVVVARRG